jgi:phenylacetic acid degradation protein paaN
MPLGITYPQVDVDTLFEAVKIAQASWSLQPTEERVGLCLEILERLAKPEALFLNAHATVHTAGQSFIMAFAGCGANALDRGLEALAYAYKAMKDVPETADWQRRFGATAETRLEKRYRLMPRGTSIVITCATFPQWNGYPAILASLSTGNPVIVKPHPKTTLPVALFVRTMREVLAEYGYDPNLVTMVADTRDQPITIELLYHPDTAIIDFTGGPQFGQWIEKNCANALVYTETAGCNSVVIESTDDFSGMCDAIAHSLCQASAQMCTSVQNIFVPEGGIETDIGHVSFDEVCDGLVTSVDKLIAEPRKAAFLCGTLVDKNIYKTIEAVAAAAKGGQVLRESTPYVHPEFENARTATPLMLKVAADDKELYGKEHFGPISFVIVSDDAAHACLTMRPTHCNVPPRMYAIMGRLRRTCIRPTNNSSSGPSTLITWLARHSRVTLSACQSILQPRIPIFMSRASTRRAMPVCPISRSSRAASALCRQSFPLPQCPVDEHEQRRNLRRWCRYDIFRQDAGSIGQGPYARRRNDCAR